VDRTIVAHEARLDDDAAMQAFLKIIPNSDQLALVLADGHPVSTRAYDDEAQTARFVTSDGHTVTCFTVSNITIDQAEMIAAACEELPASDSLEFSDVVQQALGPS
jgi:hypothetical protein